MMSMRNAVMGSRAGVFAVCAVALGIMAGCGMLQVASTWRDREVVINGNDEGYEWSHAKHFFDEEMLTIGVLNDSDYLYLRLSTPSPTLQQQVRRQGLTLWFDPTGGKEKTEGIKYPRGMQAALPAAGGNRTQTAGPAVGLGGDAPVPQQQGGGGGMMMGGRAMPGAGGGGMPGAGGGGMMNRQQATTSEELDLIGFGNSEIRTIGLGLIEPLGVEVSMNTIDDVLIYEMKIPLTAKQAEWCAIGVDSGSFSLGIEVPQAAATQSAPAMPAGGGGGGRGGAGGGGGRGGAGGGGMGAAPAGGGGAPRATASAPTASSPENVELWLKVQLATAP